jgi:unsaturated chondroitin disaccharide hydrolase
MKQIFIMLFLSIFIMQSALAKQPQKPLKEVINAALEFSTQQSLLMAKSLENQPELLPITTDRFGKLKSGKSALWTSGFFPGVLWYLYENKPTEELKKWAQNYTQRVAKEQYTTNNHDVGFMVFCSFGNGYRLTADTSYLPVIRNACKSLCTRYNPKVGVIRSWDFGRWKYPVIIDNMMNLEMLMWGGAKYNEKRFVDISNSHANKTAIHHYRPDNSCFHVVSYDTITGGIEKKTTQQGFSDPSSWARGQAWGLYGFTMMYRFTKDSAYLNKARQIATYLLQHSRMPADMIPYWDFDAPNIPDTYRDASAGAIICSALIELSSYVSKKESKYYLKIAEKQLRILSTHQYTNALGNNGNFILKSSVGFLPANSEVDVPLTYADYYYVEALMRFKKLLK